MKHKILNGWTKEKIKEQIRKYNNGYKAVVQLDKGMSRCVYLTDIGNRCAVGCFIPDGHEALERRAGAIELLQRYSDLISLMPFGPHVLEEFQSRHDCTPKDTPTVHERLFKFIDEECEE